MQAICSVSGEHAREGGGGTADIQGIWETFRQAWNATPNTKPWNALGCPTEAFGLVTDPSFVAGYPAALERLGAASASHARDEKVGHHLTDALALNSASGLHHKTVFQRGMGAWRNLGPAVL